VVCSGMQMALEAIDYLLSLIEPRNDPLQQGLPQKGHWPVVLDWPMDYASWNSPQSSTRRRFG
jgi:hypothetical protein